MTLVLDRVDGALGSPVDSIGKVRSIENLRVLGIVLLASVAEKLSVLVLRPGGEFVVGETEGILSGIVLFDIGVLKSELLETEVELFLGAEREAILSNVSLEVRL